MKNVCYTESRYQNPLFVKKNISRLTAGGLRREKRKKGRG
jgi:hypothetical protein